MVNVGLEESDCGNGGGVVVQGRHKVVVAAGVEHVDQAIAGRGRKKTKGRVSESEVFML